MAISKQCLLFHHIIFKHTAKYTNNILFIGKVLNPNFNAAMWPYLSQLSKPSTIKFLDEKYDCI